MYYTFQIWKLPFSNIWKNCWFRSYKHWVSYFSPFGRFDKNRFGSACSWFFRFLCQLISASYRFIQTMIFSKSNYLLSFSIYKKLKISKAKPAYSKYCLPFRNFLDLCSFSERGSEGGRPENDNYVRSLRLEVCRFSLPTSNFSPPTFRFQPFAQLFIFFQDQRHAFQWT